MNPCKILGPLDTSALAETGIERAVKLGRPGECRTPAWRPPHFARTG